MGAYTLLGGLIGLAGALLLLYCFVKISNRNRVCCSMLIIIVLTNTIEATEGEHRRGR